MKDSTKKEIKYHNTAGCYLIRNLKGNVEILLIYRKWSDDNQGWILPKGHIEQGESEEQAAIRETIEETGYKNFKIISKLEELKFDYLEDGVTQRKVIHYFLAELIDDKNDGLGLTKKESDSWFKIEWFSLDEALKLMKFDDEREILRKTIEKINANEYSK